MTTALLQRHYKVSAAARFIGCSRATTYRLVQDGKLAAYRHPELGLIVIAEETLVAWQGRMEPVTERNGAGRRQPSVGDTRGSVSKDSGGRNNAGGRSRRLNGEDA